MAQAAETPTTRRSFFAGVVALAPLAIPAIALAATPSDDARFLEWEREHAAALIACDERGLSDEEGDRRMDELVRVEEMISLSPCATLTGVAVKARLVLLGMEQSMHGSDFELASMRHVVNTLAALASRA